MLDFSFAEIMVVFVVALLVLGPERLPKVARQVGWWVGRIRASVATMREELEREASLQDLEEVKREIQKGLEQAKTEVEATVDEAAKEVRETRASVEKTADEIRAAASAGRESSNPVKPDQDA